MDHNCKLEVYQLSRINDIFLSHRVDLAPNREREREREREIFLNAIPTMQNYKISNMKSENNIT